MALETEESHVGLVELEELEAIEIDEALLRELLEEEQEADVEESVQKNDNKTKDQKQQDHQNQQHEGCNIDHHFEWMSNNNNNNMVMNWYPDDDDMVGMMVDFGYTNNNAQFGSHVSEGLICYEASSYGCLWHDL
ncbi:hypothetical protein QN277_016718 [Acacia crassicarpa]|uniref:Uncharacterized protein n=1 Tax=Acacia crassicarpa TaxID=499986 RepID=A0AAE1MX89_9FABA|nr:hypothetical protein QN277_016718 [Acacia crassicarpa]